MTTEEAMAADCKRAQEQGAARRQLSEALKPHHGSRRCPICAHVHMVGPTGRLICGGDDGHCYCAAEEKKANPAPRTPQVGDVWRGERSGMEYTVVARDEVRGGFITDVSATDGGIMEDSSLAAGNYEFVRSAQDAPAKQDKPWAVGQRRRGAQRMCDDQPLEYQPDQEFTVVEKVKPNPDEIAADWYICRDGTGRRTHWFRESWPSELLEDAPGAPAVGEKPCTCGHPTAKGTHSLSGCRVGNGAKPVCCEKGLTPLPERGFGFCIPCCLDAAVEATDVHDGTPMCFEHWRKAKAKPTVCDQGAAAAPANTGEPRTTHGAPPSPTSPICHARTRSGIPCDLLTGHKRPCGVLPRVDRATPAGVSEAELEELAAGPWRKRGPLP